MGLKFFCSTENAQPVKAPNEGTSRQAGCQPASTSGRTPPRPRLPRARPSASSFACLRAAGATSGLQRRSPRAACPAGDSPAHRAPSLTVGQGRAWHSCWLLLAFYLCHPLVGSSWPSDTVQKACMSWASPCFPVGQHMAPN